MSSQYLSGERVFLFLVCSRKKDTKFCFSIGPFIFANCIYDVKVLESLAWCCVFCEGKHLWIWAYTDMSWKKRWFCSGAVAFFTVSGLEPMLGLFYAKYDFSATKTLNRKVISTFFFSITCFLLHGPWTLNTQETISMQFMSQTKNWYLQIPHVRIVFEESIVRCLFVFFQLSNVNAFTAISDSCVKEIAHSTNQFFLLLSAICMFTPRSADNPLLSTWPKSSWIEILLSSLWSLEFITWFCTLYTLNC